MTLYMLRRILIKELLDFVQSEEYRQMPVVPISPQRALSHFNNPRALPDDVALVLIYDEKQVMTGYLGVLPDALHLPTGIERVGWLSCMWVNPDLRGQGLSKKLIQSVFEAWDYRILVTEFTPAAKGLYDSTKQFIDLAKPAGIRCYLRPNLAYLLPNKNEKHRRWRALLRCADACLSLPNALRLAFYSPKGKKPDFCYVREVDKEAFAFISQYRKMELMNRQEADLQWISRFPWLVATEAADNISARYHFSVCDTRFDFLNIKIYDNQQLIGFLMLSVRGKNLKVPYAYFQPEHTAQAAAVIIEHLMALKLDMLTVFQPLLVAYFQQNKAPFFKIRPFNRHYIVSKKFQAQLSGLEFGIQDGDADAAFT